MKPETVTSTDGTEIALPRIYSAPVAGIKPYSGNPRQIPEEAVTAVAESIKLYGWTQPILIDGDGTIIAGHTRYAAAQRMGLKTVPVVSKDDLTPDQADRLRLVDNRTSEMTGWDMEALVAEVVRMGMDDADDLPGFSDDEINILLAAEEIGGGGVDPGGTVAPPQPANPLPDVGDLVMLQFNVPRRHAETLKILLQTTIDEHLKNQPAPAA